MDKLLNETKEIVLKKYGNKEGMETQEDYHIMKDHLERDMLASAETLSSRYI